jgi:hypothetical protein
MLASGRQQQRIRSPPIISQQQSAQMSCVQQLQVWSVLLAVR